MANFQTHLNGGLFVSGATVLALNGAGFVQPGQTLPFFALGVAGSLMPDIDLDTSRPVRAFFTVLGVALAFAMTLPLVGRVPWLELALIWGGVFLCVRYGFFEIFARYTVHRGIWHSWLAAAFAALIAADAAYWLMEQDPHVSWVAAFMVTVGYFTHLCLDELYSVDLLNSRLKSSFGTALKPFSFNDPLSSVLMGCAVLALAWVAPPFQSFPRIVALWDRLRLQMQSLPDLLNQWEALWRRLFE